MHETSSLVKLILSLLRIFRQVLTSTGKLCLINRVHMQEIFRSSYMANGDVIFLNTYCMSVKKVGFIHFHNRAFLLRTNPEWSNKINVITMYTG